MAAPGTAGSALTGPVEGDTGVYVWNLWVFRHEIVAHRRFPLFTHEILALAPPVDLSLHNYTLFANTLAFPLLPFLGVTVTFNVIFLAISALTAWTMYLLARRVVGPSPEAWLAGLLFGFSPVLVARSAEHFSLVAAAPLPIFVLCLMRLEEKPTTLNALAAGATIAWAATCDPYFAVYCLLIAACYGAVRIVRIRRGTPPSASNAESAVRSTWRIAATFLVVVGLALFMNLTGATEVRPFGLRIELSMHAPVVVLMVLVIARVVARTRPVVEIRWPMPPADCLRLAGVAVVAATVLLSPVLYTLSIRLADGGSLHAPIYWRSGPKGIDLIALFMPNPGNKLFGAPARAWLTGQNNGYTDNVAALTIVATLLVAFAVWRYRFRPPPLWTAMAVFFGAADPRAVHLHRRREHLRPRAVGAAQICAARVGGEDARPLRHRADDGVRRHLCARASPCPRAVGRSAAVWRSPWSRRCWPSSWRRCRASSTRRPCPTSIGPSPAIHATFACWAFRWASWTARAAKAETMPLRSTTRRSIRSRLSAAACRAFPCGSASGSGCSR